MINKDNISSVFKAAKGDLNDFNLKSNDLKRKTLDQWDLIYCKNNTKIYYFNYKNLEGYCIKKDKLSYIIELNGFNGYDSGADDAPVIIKNSQMHTLELNKQKELSDFTFKFENEIVEEDINDFIKIINNIISE